MTEPCAIHTCKHWRFIQSGAILAKSLSSDSSRIGARRRNFAENRPKNAWSQPCSGGGHTVRSFLPECLLKRFWPTVLLCCTCAAFAAPADAATTLVPSRRRLYRRQSTRRSRATRFFCRPARPSPAATSCPPKAARATSPIRSSAPDSALPPAGTRITPAYASRLPRSAPRQRRRRRSRPPPARPTGACCSSSSLRRARPAAPISSSSAARPSQNDAGRGAAASRHRPLLRPWRSRASASGAAWRSTAATRRSSIRTSPTSRASLQDTQAIGGWNGPGPFLIENNYIEAAGENIMFGGNDPNIPNLVPSNITIRRNLISKPLAWMTQAWTVKNLIELKNARTCSSKATRSRTTGRPASRATRSCSRRATRTTPRRGRWCKNITVQNNVIRHVAAVFNVLGYDNLAPSQQT